MQLPAAQVNPREAAPRQPAVCSAETLLFLGSESEAIEAAVPLLGGVRAAEEFAGIVAGVV